MPTPTTSPTPAAREDLRATIVDAAARLLQEDGASAVTTRAVAHAAGVQAPTIYRLFGDKDGLIDAVAEHVLAIYVAEKSAAASRDDGDPVVDLRAAWHRHVDFGMSNAELYVLLNTPGRTSRSPATTAGIEVLRARVRRLAEAGLLRVDEERAVDLIHAAGTGVILSLLQHPAGERDLRLSDTMFDLVVAGIVASESATPDTGTSSVAVTFLTVLPELAELTDAERTLMAEWVERSLAAR